jgi:hypothetical protein
MGTAPLGYQVFVAIDRALVLALAMQHTTRACLFNSPSALIRAGSTLAAGGGPIAGAFVQFSILLCQDLGHYIQSCHGMSCHVMSWCCPSINAILKAHTLCPPPTMLLLLQPATARFDGAKGLCGPGKPTACPAAGTA